MKVNPSDPVSTSDETVNPTLRVTEIFYSLQGESLTVGLPTVFVRLSGCPLRCVYCDTAYAFSGGERMDLPSVIQSVKQHHCSHVTLTGGEPLAQKAAIPLLVRLCDAGLHVSLETSGALPINEVDPRVTIVMDLKTPGSGESQRNIFENFQYLKPGDQLKFVIANRKDYEWSRKCLEDHAPPNGVGVLFSPVWGSMPPADLAEWILEDRLPVRLQLQLHKILWGEARGR